MCVYFLEARAEIRDFFGGLLEELAFETLGSFLYTVTGKKM